MEASCPVLRIREVVMRGGDIFLMEFTLCFTSLIALLFVKVCARVGGLLPNRAILEEGCNLSRTVNATLNPLTS